ncbi:TPA: hypothetical protein DIC40_03820 [Patescibacteria group bacterium]|nr:hypothetical protein P148_SR1C00001G0469 [candidate division SR1 bacterium RAAC1_SR1_1]HCY20966.1 hypothetical protein [Candidatus Gracilibacteria bacterium]
MNTKNNKSKNIQRIVDIWTEKIFNIESSVELNNHAEKVGQGAFVWSNVLDINNRKKESTKAQDFKKMFSSKIEKHYPHIHISSQGMPRGILKETLQDLDMDMDMDKSIKIFSTWIQDDKVYLKDGNNPPQIIDSDEPTISS